MTKSNYLSPLEKKFAELVAYNYDNVPPHVLVYQAGFEGNITNALVKAGILLRNKKVSKLIHELQEERNTKISNNLHDKSKTIDKLFNSIIHEAQRQLSYGKTSRAADVLKRTKPILKWFSDTLYRLEKPIKVYLAEETRPYPTGHYKIGMTTQENINDRKTYTDNPYEINYICYFEYLPKYGFDLEKKLHHFFKNYSTNKFKDTGSTEWFLLKNKKAILKAFYNASLHLLNKHECKHNFVKL